MKIWTDKIKELDANADPDLVLDIADDLFRIFGEMTHDQWQECIEKSHMPEWKAIYA